MTGRTSPRGELRPALDDLVHRYAGLADQRRADELVELFSPSGVLVLPTPPERLDPHHEVCGRTAILEHLAVLEELSVAVHELVGQVYDVTGPREATAASRTTGRRRGSQGRLRAGLGHPAEVCVLEHG
jgi:hypothetical protein